MQEVSESYKASMKETLRERGYIMLTFGLVTQEAQSNATIDNDPQAYFSTSSSMFRSGTDKYVYATVEEDFTKVDGTQYFAPREESGTPFLNTGLTTNGLVSETIQVLVISTNVPAIRVMGFTINWGENYAIDFELSTDAGQVITVTDNDSSEWVTTDILEEFTTITLTVSKMLHEATRVRIYSIMFGYGLSYDNSSVIDSTLDNYVSPISEEVPQIDFSITLTNYDNKFDTDNPNSPASFLETGQEMNIYYGYETPGADEIEWFQGAQLWCSSWECTDTSVTIRTRDMFREQDTEYTDGEFSPEGTSLYDLAVTAFEFMDIDDYYIDESLQSMYTCNPLPLVAGKELVQIIANAACCILTQSRSGTAQIMPSNTEVSDFTMEYMDMRELPTKNKQELVKEVIVPYYVYQDAEEQSNLVTEDVSVSSGDSETYYFSDASYGFTALLDSEEDGVEITASSAYSVTVTYSVEGSYRLQIYGYKYVISERYVTSTLNTRGSSIKWTNPLIDRKSLAEALAAWLAVYYASRVEYTYDTRGNPELDTNDIIYQQNDYDDDMKVMVTNTTLKFNGGFSGSVTTRRWEG